MFRLRRCLLPKELAVCGNKEPVVRANANIMDHRLPFFSG